MTIDTKPFLSRASSDAYEEFMQLRDVEYVEAWKKLSAPRFDELDGEYEKEFGRNYNETLQSFLREGLNNLDSPTGAYLRKGFTPHGAATGEGYNAWVFRDGREVRNMRFATHLGRSLVDGRPALMATYSSFAAGTPLEPLDEVLEIRRLAEGVYVCCTTARLDALIEMNHPWLAICESYGWERSDGYSFRDRTPATPGIFVLSGPASAYVGADV